MAVIEKKYTEHLMTEYAKKFLKENYDMELGIPIIISARMTKTYGCFWHKRNIKLSLNIKMSLVYIENQPWEMVLDVLRHELIHYALYEKDLPYKDGQKCFEDNLRKHNSKSTHTIPFKGKVVVYKCDCCGKEFHKHRRYKHDGATMRTRCCGAGITNVGSKVV